MKAEESEGYQSSLTKLSGWTEELYLAPKKQSCCVSSFPSLVSESECLMDRGSVSIHWFLLRILLSLSNTSPLVFTFLSFLAVIFHHGLKLCFHSPSSELQVQVSRLCLLTVLTHQLLSQCRGNRLQGLNVQLVPKFIIYIFLTKGPLPTSVLSAVWSLSWLTTHYTSRKFQN